ncbi:hypothetical protein M378DRAFT_199231 [Amanita muscaria Koide BX008]|uniref:Uncharacterized protein n=1 Tax=Amanita muscaria (strain Koide BX008) TaxID=946122 RepID=A0A0C2SGW1_AMAMK|nr:hypothetical protein M378DRAFT_199231 [Amanita muscaria Koide BX008]
MFEHVRGSNLRIQSEGGIGMPYLIAVSFLISNISSASKFPRQRVTDTMTDRTAGYARIATLRTTPSSSDRDAPPPSRPEIPAAEMSNDKATPQPAPFKLRFNLNIAEQLGNFNVGSYQRNTGGVYKISGEKEGSEKNESGERHERQEFIADSENQPTVNLGKLHGDFNFGDDQLNEGGKYEL